MRKILLVDDEPFIRNSLRIIFEEKGYQIDCAANGIEALKFFERAKYSVVILDLVLPQLDGKKFIDIVKKICDGTKIIVITAYPFLGRAIKSIQEDIVCVKEKPFDLNELVECVEGLYNDF